MLSLAIEGPVNISTCVKHTGNQYTTGLLLIKLTCTYKCEMDANIRSCNTVLTYWSTITYDHYHFRHKLLDGMTYLTKQDRVSVICISLVTLQCH